MHYYRDIEMVDPQNLHGLRVLLVEDDYFIATDLALALTEQGVIISGPASSVQQGLLLIDQSEPLDAAILDLNLGTEQSYPLAKELSLRRVPYLFLTGYGRASVDPSHRDVPLLEKPVNLANLIRALAAILKPDPSVD
jgi:DNA-binding response OmpR family regulator